MKRLITLGLVSLLGLAQGCKTIAYERKTQVHVDKRGIYTKVYEFRSLIPDITVSPAEPRKEKRAY